MCFSGCPGTIFTQPFLNWVKETLSLNVIVEMLTKLANTSLKAYCKPTTLLSISYEQFTNMFQAGVQFPLHREGFGAYGV